MTEHWRAIPGYEGRYEVSSEGRIRVVARVIPYIDGRLRRVPSRVRKLGLTTTGYPSAPLTDASGVTKNRTVHTLVAAAFLGPRPSGQEVCHNDGNKLNPRLANLRYDTRRENALDHVRHGNHYWAKRTHCKHGHEYTPDNTYMDKGRRICRTCTRARLAKSKAKRKKAA